MVTRLVYTLPLLLHPYPMPCYLPFLPYLPSWTTPFICLLTTPFLPVDYYLQFPHIQTCLHPSSYLPDLLPWLFYPAVYGFFFPYSGIPPTLGLVDLLLPCGFVLLVYTLTYYLHTFVPTTITYHIYTFYSYWLYGGLHMYQLPATHAAHICSSALLHTTSHTHHPTHLPSPHFLHPALSLLPCLLPTYPHPCAPTACPAFPTPTCNSPVPIPCLAFFLPAPLPPRLGLFFPICLVQFVCCVSVLCCCILGAVGGHTPAFHSLLSSPCLTSYVSLYLQVVYLFHPFDW